MSFLPKIKNITSLVASATSNLAKKLNGGERHLSKRFTIGKNCKPAPKKKPCDSSVKVEMKRELKSKQSELCASDPCAKCEPFPKKGKMKKALRKCKPSMKGSCAEVTCPDNCSLTGGSRKLTVDNCSLDGSGIREKECPKGDWQREK